MAYIVMKYLVVSAIASLAYAVFLLVGRAVHVWHQGAFTVTSTWWSVPLLV